MSGPPDGELTYGSEVIRKTIHLCSLSIPVGYYFLDKATALAVLIPVTAAFAITDVARLYFPPVGRLYYALFGWLLRPHERSASVRRLNGATYVLLSACLCISIFPKVVFITAFAILIVSDTFAALVGRKIGKHPFLHKTLEGTGAFLVTACVVVLFSPKIGYLPAEYLIGLVGALIGALVEAVSIAIDDNLSIPLTIGGTMWLLYFLLLPSINVLALDS